jgi:hypothetical protein
MSCFSAMTTTTGGRGTYYYSSSPGRPRGGGGGKRPWRRWRAKCAGIAAAVGSRLRRSVVRAVDGGRRRTPPPSSSSVHRGWCHHHHHGRQSFAPVYVDDLYSHSLQPAAKAHRGVVVQQEQVHEPPSTSARDKLPATDAAAPAHGASASSNRQQARAMAAGVAAMRNVLLRSPGRGGGGVLGVVKGMGEVDLRAELFIRKFKEDMRLQSQRSAEELQAMLARGL